MLLCSVSQHMSIIFLVLSTCHKQTFEWFECCLCIKKVTGRYLRVFLASKPVFICLFGKVIPLITYTLYVWWPYFHLIICTLFCACLHLQSHAGQQCSCKAFCLLCPKCYGYHRYLLVQYFHNIPHTQLLMSTIAWEDFLCDHSVYAM
jgi:hypothetical protein